MGQQVREDTVNIEQELNETPTNLYAPHEWRHGTVVAGVPWKNPVGTASGTFNVDACGQFYDVAQLGSVTTKGVSPVEWLGNPGVRTAESPAGTVNAVGIAVEELCHNIATYARTSGNNAVDVCVRVMPDKVNFRLRDNGAEFDPTDYIDNSGKRITGLELVRMLSSSVNYNRVLGFNVTNVAIAYQ